MNNCFCRLILKFLLCLNSRSSLLMSSASRTGLMLFLKFVILGLELLMTFIKSLRQVFTLRSRPLGLGVFKIVASSRSMRGASETKIRPRNAIQATQRLPMLAGPLLHLKQFLGVTVALAVATLRCLPCVNKLDCMEEIRSNNYNQT